MAFIIGFGATLLVPFFSGRRSNHMLLNYFLEHRTVWALWGTAIGAFAAVIIFFKRKDNKAILSIEINDNDEIISFETKDYYAFNSCHAQLSFKDLIFTVNSYNTEFEYHLKIDFYKSLNGNRALIGTLSNQDFLCERKGQVIKQLRKKLETIKK
ncbi:MAG: hypothetical protein ACO3E1_10965 [Flavobacteriales bacterium]